MAAGRAGIFVVDISDPADRTVVGSWDSPGIAEAVAVVGTILFVADGPYGLRVVSAETMLPPQWRWAGPSP